MTLKQTALAFLVIVGAFLLWPRSDDTDLRRAEENGYRAARKAQMHRTLAAVALARRDSAIRSTDARFAAARARLNAFRFVPVESLTVQIDSNPRPIVGPFADGDTLISLRLARLKVIEVVNTADSLITGLQAVVMLERGRSSLAIQHLEATIANQDTVIRSLSAQLKAKHRPWYRRAASGVEHAVTGALCGAAGYVLAGPVGGIGSAVVCAAVSGVRR